MNKKGTRTNGQTVGQKVPKVQQRQFANIVTGDETQVHCFEPVRKIENRLSLSKHGRRPVFVKRTMNTKKVLYATCFLCDGIAVPKDRSVTGQYYHDILNSSRHIIKKDAQ